MAKLDSAFYCLRKHAFISYQLAVDFNECDHQENSFGNGDIKIDDACAKESILAEGQTSSSVMLSSPPCFKSDLVNYFEDQLSSANSATKSSIALSEVPKSLVLVRADIQTFLRTWTGKIKSKLTAMAVARIFSGISSPAHSASDWQKNEVWGQHKDVDFGTLLNFAVAARKQNKTILQQKKQ